MRSSYHATRDSRWEEFGEKSTEKGKSSVWALEAIRDAYEKVVEEEARRLGIVREILRKTRSS